MWGVHFVARMSHNFAAMLIKRQVYIFGGSKQEASIINCGRTTTGSKCSVKVLYADRQRFPDSMDTFVVVVYMPANQPSTEMTMKPNKLNYLI